MSVGTAQVRVTEVDDGVAEVTLDRPEALNALSLPMLDALADAVAQARRTRARVLVLTSSSTRAFCVGADLKERGALTAQQFEAARPAMIAAYRSFLRADIPVVAAVSGYCLGGGFELALGADFIVCDDTAVFGLPEVRVGIIPGGGGTQLLSRRTGWGPAAELVMTGRRVDAHQALALGVVDRLVDDAREGAWTLARELTAGAPTALAAAKRAMVEGWGRPLELALDIEDQHFAGLLTGEDRLEGARAFAEKRAPVWPSLRA
ncbi:enoyl-CoA hydratase/isomerase family protein [Nocardioides acrostichi]|uniref:Enoyl-CoA hydratase/isomerase family protein n=1 Tax=Nocardioides acrostichi TaxID=2784339 RepID=A0A930YCA4_9ACTN|nr:enoyl-CoA hydratase/isomerase family protein [Nocardioides acrostichi]MBF4163283.1 enoyl-CoA hydratase/isomerase family protein [Nocardioides acrostichi]